MKQSPARSPCRRQEQRGGQPHSPAAVEHRAGSGTRDSGAGSGPSPLKTARTKRHLEGVLRKYTNPLQGWQSSLLLSAISTFCDDLSITFHCVTKQAKVD
ncbi:Oxysterol-binding protein-related protein 10, partial [Dissostichus eleginoides]